MVVVVVVFVSRLCTVPVEVRLFNSSDMVLRLDIDTRVSHDNRFVLLKGQTGLKVWIALYGNPSQRYGVSPAISSVLPATWHASTRFNYPGGMLSWHTVAKKYKADVRQTTKSADFCGRGLVAQQNRLTESVNHDTRPIVLSATSYTLSDSTTVECRSQNNTCITFFLHLMNENK